MPWWPETPDRDRLSAALILWLGTALAGFCLALALFSVRQLWRLRVPPAPIHAAGVPR